MNDARTVAELERSLRTTDPAPLQPARLAAIRSQGRRRRRARLAAVAGGTAAAVAVVTVGVAALAGAGPGDGGAPVAKEPRPRELSALAERVLAEVPGAVRVSDWQVVLPRPDGAEPEWGDPVPAKNVAAGPVEIGTRDYDGVTAYPAGAFPRWLHDGVAAWEQDHGDDQGGYPVGSTDMGIAVDAGPLRLACVTSLPQWGGKPADGCFPAMLSGPDGDLAYEWGMGTDDFLQEGEELELFSTETFVGGRAATVWVGGTDGTDVASVELVGTDGTVVPASVASGTLVPGETMFWGTVEGDLARAVTRDADGEVLEDHEVAPCSDPVDCEVR